MAGEVTVRAGKQRGKAGPGETGRLAREEPWGKLGGRLGLCWLASGAATSRGCGRPSGTASSKVAQGLAQGHREERGGLGQRLG